MFCLYIYQQEIVNGRILLKSQNYHGICKNATRPGVKCSEIADELNEMLLSEGMLQLRTFGYGHSFGVISHYYGRGGDGHVSL